MEFYRIIYCLQFFIIMITNFYVFYLYVIFLTHIKYQYKNQNKYYILNNFNNMLSISTSFLKQRKLIVQQIFTISSLTNKLSFCISNNKFYQIVSETDPKQISYSIPQENILTKYLQSSNTQNNFNSQQINRFYKKLPQQTIYSKLKKVNYKQILSQNSTGSIITRKYKNTDLCLAGMNYSNTSYDNIYKSILKFQPDCIIVQNKPENFCQNFQIIKKNAQTNVFSDKLYIQQLQLNKSFDLKKNFTENDLNNLQGNLFPRKKLVPKKIDSYKVNKQSEYFPFLSKEIVNQKPLMSSIYNSLKKNVPIYLGEIPQSVHRQHICNTHTLMELQQLYKITCKSLPLYSGINLTPYQLATYLFPQQFLSINDKYMATLIEIMISLGYKKVMIFCGVAENKAIWQILQNNYHCDDQNNINPLLTYLIAQKIKGNVIRDYDILQVLQKHILFDALYQGKDLKQIKISQFKTTNKIINKYTSKQSKQMIFKFKYQMYLKYSELLNQCIQEGEKRKIKQFMRTAMR